MHSEILLTLWPPVESSWAEIESEIKKEFKVISAETFSFEENSGHWVNFIVELYRMCYEPEERCKYPDIEKMVQKAYFMRRFSRNVRLVKVRVDNPNFMQFKGGNPYGLQSIKDLKNKIREKHSNIPRFSVIHSFDTPARNELIVTMLERFCKKV